MVFPSKIDSWMLILVVLTVAVSLVAAVSAVLQSRGVASLTGAAIALLLGAMFPAWLFTSTYYTVSGDLLLVRSGPFSWRIALSSIETVRETRNPLSGPALSLDRLEIHYGDGRTLMVSPQDKAAFVAAIGGGDS